MQSLLWPAVHSGISTPVSVEYRQFFSSLSSCSLSNDQLKNTYSIVSLTKRNASSPTFNGFTSPNDDIEKAKLVEVAKRLEKTSWYFMRLGTFGFWGQLICTVVAAVILSFLIVVTGKISLPTTFYSTAGGMAAGFISVFWSFGYIRISEKLRKTANDPSKAPPRVDLVKSLKNDIVLNLLGMGAAILGMQA